MRSMELKVGGEVVYESSFNEETGTIVRVVESPSDRYSSRWSYVKGFKERYPERAWRPVAFSPVPETVDVSVTDACSFGCSYCYQDSRPRRPHAPRDLVSTIIRGFDQPPYQVAIGGGEPTQHPDFEWILREARALGTVPNYTTAGHAMTQPIIDATNEVCGGVALTYHAFRGIDWFTETYAKLRRALRVQLNVHLIADVDVAANLGALVDRVGALGPLNLVLLAYYEGVGRSTSGGVMPKRVYDRELPPAIRRAMGAGFKVAFSEGLLPYFLSRSEVGVDTRFAMCAEGRFSCYFDPRGCIGVSSFSSDRSEGTAYDTRSQVLWDRLHLPYLPHGEPCGDCADQDRCHAPQAQHMLACARMKHNQSSGAAGGGRTPRRLPVVE